MKINPNDLIWEEIPGRYGTFIKHLNRDESRNFQVDLMKLNPNTTFHTHTHPDIEWVYVLEGTFSDHRGKFIKGDFLLNEKNSIHTAVTGDEGAQLLVCWCGKVIYK